MSQQYLINSCINCLPFSRTKLFREVFEFKTLGEINQLWFGPGHLFVSVASGKQLLTFDCKTVEYIQDAENQGCLDLNEDSSVVQVLWKPPNIALVVFQNGVILFWTYKPDHVWKQQTMHRLCHGHMTSVVDVCFNLSQNALYWCQQDIADDGNISFSICKRLIIEDEGHRDVMKLGMMTNIITQCPRSSIYPMGNGVVLITQPVTNQAQFIIRLCSLKGDIEILVNNEWHTVRDVNVHTLPVKFSQIAMKCLQHLKKLKDLSVLRKTYSAQSQTLHVLSNSGDLHTLSYSKDCSKVELHGFNKENLVGIFMQNDCIGLAYNDNIRFHDIQSGELLCSVDVPNGSRILQLGETLLGALQQTILTENNLSIVQKCCDKQERSEMSLLELCNFQSDAVRLSYIDQMLKYSTESSGTLSLESLKEKWISSMGTPPTTKLSEIVEPYLSQYWKLDNLLNQGLEDANKISQFSPESEENEVLHLLSTDSTLPFSARQSQLVLLSTHFPQEVLECLLSYLNFDDSEMSTSQYQRWQNALTQESPTLTGSVNSPLPIFELTCHLLFTHKPDKLIQFVLQGQKMWDQKVGMSAFVRRRQIPLIHERALKCFSHPEHSVDPDTAILAHVHILLISHMNNGFTEAVHLLTKAKKWTEVVELLTEYRDKCPQFGLLYQITLAALTKNRVLDKYAEKLFALMPNVHSTNDVLEVSRQNQQECSIFCEGSEDITVESVRQHFLKCMKNL